MARLEIGVLVFLSENPEALFQKVLDVGLKSCQLCSWAPQLWTDRIGDETRKLADSLGIKITTFWAGYPGPSVWNFVDGPRTIGLVPAEHREMRVKVLQQAADWAARLSIPSITTHVGFIPEDPNHPDFAGTVEALKQVAGRCAERGIGFNFETGQETPVTLLRTIERVGTGNLGVNLDPANLILYGKASPVDALDVFGSYVREVHAKDGNYPTNGTDLGEETPLGEGKVNFPVLIPKLKACGFTGTLTIEREISGEKQVADIRKAIELLGPLC